ncbi:hypothetical protein PR048_021553 [Dryococelus australis]|uniref:Uncharacterized protein n=1 Tax=Dryococelus australis TaxID=614101 RepID=A0ABQ9GYQ5_9NEOP|nr:hypothetical protein PR048_021553 [Dryococelus australis]
MLQHGHEVVQSQLYHCELNAIEFLWNMVQKVSQDGASIEKLTIDAINYVSKKRAGECYFTCL